MGKIIFGLALAVLISGGVMAGEVEQRDLHPGYIFVGSVGDGGWSYAMNQGRLRADAQFAQVKSMAAEFILEGGETLLAVEQLINRGRSKLIIATSHGYGKFVLALAAKYPQVKFVHISGEQQAPNVSTYFGRIYQPRYLSGLVAGSMSKTNLIGYVAAYPIPEVVRGINAFTIGVRQVNPEAKVKVLWLSAWYDTVKERELSSQLIAMNCDVIALHADSGEVARVCEAANVYVVGYNNDMSIYAPTMHLTAPVWRWEPLLAHAYKQVLEGKWVSEKLWWGLKEGVVGLAPLGAMVPERVRQLVEERQKRIISGELDIFAGPLRDNLGQLRVEENQTMSDAQMLTFDWFVEGVDGELQ